MARKTGRKNRAPGAAPAPEVRPAPLAAPGEGEEPGNGRRLWILSLFLIVSGYALLHKVDPGGRNAWSVVSPALLLAGYLLIIPAIVFTYRR